MKILSLSLNLPADGELEEVLFNFYNYNSKKKAPYSSFGVIQVFFKDVIFSVVAIHLTWMQAHFQRL